MGALPLASVFQFESEAEARYQAGQSAGASGHVVPSVPLESAAAGLAGRPLHPLCSRMYTFTGRTSDTSSFGAPAAVASSSAELAGDCVAPAYDVMSHADEYSAVGYPLPLPQSMLGIASMPPLPIFFTEGLAPMGKLSGASPNPVLSRMQPSRPFDMSQGMAPNSVSIAAVSRVYFPVE